MTKQTTIVVIGALRVKELMSPKSCSNYIILSGETNTQTINVLKFCTPKLPIKCIYISTGPEGAV